MLLKDTYLYEEVDNEILGYLMVPKAYDMRVYKRKELEPIVKENGIFEATSNCSVVLQSVIENNEKSVSFYDLISTGVDYWGDNSVHNIIKDSDVIRSQDTIDHYYNGDYSNAYAVKIRKRSDYPTITIPTDYLLLTNSKYNTKKNDFFNSYSYYKMPGIIPITESLYYLQLLENRHFEYIENYDIEEQLKLFDYQKEPKLIVSKEMLNQLLEGDLIEKDVYDKVRDTVKQSNKILQLVRNYKL